MRSAPREGGIQFNIDNAHFSGLENAMKYINKNSKKGKFYIDRFLNRPANHISLPTLYECYGVYSLAKLKAYNHCFYIVEKYAANSGSDVKRIVEDWGVLSYNNDVFTFGARIFCHDTEFGILYYEFIVITTNNVYLIK